MSKSSRYQTIDQHVPWYDRTPSGRAFGGFIKWTSPIWFLGMLFVLTAITGELKKSIIPTLLVDIKGGNIFTVNATFTDWIPNSITGFISWLLFVGVTLFINLMFVPLYWWLSLNNRYKVMCALAIGLLPFYIFGLELFGVMATKIMNNFDMQTVCNLDSYYNFMNISCMRYGAATVAIILAIELGIASIIAGILTLRDHMMSGSTKVIESQTPTLPLSNPSLSSPSDTTIELETDPQQATG